MSRVNEYNIYIKLWYFGFAFDSIFFSSRIRDAWLSESEPGFVEQLVCGPRLVDVFVFDLNKIKSF